MARSVLLTSVLAVAVAALVACSNETPGQPSGSVTPTGGTASSDGPFSTPNVPGSPSASTGSSGSSRLENVAACSLLTASDATSLGAEPTAKETNRTNSRDCEYKKSGSFTIGVTVYEKLGIKDVTDRGSVKPITVGKHEAVQGVSPGGLCAIAIKVTESSRVDATASANGDEQRSCDLVLPLAEAVEKKLP